MERAHRGAAQCRVTGARNREEKEPPRALDASENLDEACEACHKSYWYPKEDDTFYRTLDKRLHDAPAPKGAFVSLSKR